MVVTKQDQLIRTVSARDGMLDARHPEAYFEVGASALRCVRLALRAIGKEQPSRILDFPCGHGRVLRFLRMAYPDAELTACDIERDGVDFCAATFGARGVYSDAALERVSLPGGFDLIWVGSLLTHLPDERWAEFLAFFVSQLAPDGLLIFTTHGPWCAEQMRRGASRLGGPRIQSETLDGYETAGFGFSSYPGRDGYGVSLTSPSAAAHQVGRLEGMRLVLYLERGWASHQDVVACQRGYTAPTD